MQVFAGFFVKLSKIHVEFLKTTFTFLKKNDTQPFGKLRLKKQIHKQ